jgi:hypothetical protein
MERRLALAREAPAGMRAARVAAAAEPGNGRQVAAGAEQWALAHGKAAASPRSLQESQSSRGETAERGLNLAKAKKAAR